jgi:hypothetical protein
MLRTSLPAFALFKTHFALGTAHSIMPRSRVAAQVEAAKKQDLQNKVVPATRSVAFRAQAAEKQVAQGKVPLATNSERTRLKRKHEREVMTEDLAQASAVPDELAQALDAPTANAGRMRLYRL